MKTYTEFITEATSRGSHINLAPLGKAVLKTTAKVGWKVGKAVTKTALRAVRDYGQKQPKGSKRRAVADTLDKVRMATLSNKERARRTRENERKQRRTEIEVNSMRREREKEQRPTQNRGRYRNVGAGTRETVR